GNGNITYLEDSSQDLAASYVYDSYGNAISSYGSLASANTHQFSSKEYMAGPGLYYCLYRFYDPSLERWPNRDPLTEAGFESSVDNVPADLVSAVPPNELLQGPNLYQFVRNEPVFAIDAWGLGWHTPGGRPANPMPACPCPPGQHLGTRAEAAGGTLACVRRLLTSTLTGLGVGGVSLGVGGYAGGTIGAGGAGVGGGILGGGIVGGVVGTGGGILVG